MSLDLINASPSEYLTSRLIQIIFLCTSCIEELLCLLISVISKQNVDYIRIDNLTSIFHPFFYAFKATSARKGVMAEKRLLITL